MEKFQDCSQQANKFFNTADHLTYITFPLVKEIKLMITITENLYFAVMNAMDAILEYDKLYKRIDILSNDFDLRFETFRQECAKRYNLRREYITMINELRNIILNHKKSPMEFIKNNNIVIYSQNQVNTISMEKIKQYLPLTRQFLNDINKILK